MKSQKIAAQHNTKQSVIRPSPRTERARFSERQSYARFERGVTALDSVLR